MVDVAASSQIRSRLLRGEVLVWSGVPKQGFMLQRRDGLLIPFSLFICGFAIFWEVGASRASGLALFPFFGVPLVLFGLFAVLGRFLIDSWLRRRTIYALTDRRILIARSGPWPSFTALLLAQLPEANLTELSEERGTIRFGRPSSLFDRGASDGMSGWVASLDPTPQFLGIKDARRVFTMVQERIDGSRAM